MTQGALDIFASEDVCLGCFSQAKNGEICASCGFDPQSPNANTLVLAPGTLLREQYVIGNVLGHGGFGITYLAWDRNLNLRLAIKEYFPSQWASREPGTSEVSIHSQEAKEFFQSGLEKFLDEGRTLARFHQVPGIVAVVNFFRENKTGYLVMSYVDGITLKQYLDEREGKILFDAAVRILMPVMDALAAVHEAGVLHRDISPDNIYITRTGQVKLLDFGAARMALGEQEKSLSVIYKPGFAPPEQYMSQGRQGRWTDVYALAATLYRSVTGIIPTQSVERFYKDELIPPSQLGVEIAPEMEVSLMKALAVNFEHRYQTMREFQHALLVPEVLEREDSEPRKQDVIPPRPKKEKREQRFSLSPKLLLGAAAVLLLLVATYFIAGLFKSSALVEERLRGRWEQPKTTDGAPIGARWQLTREGPYTFDFTYKDKGTLTLRNAASWTFTSQKNSSSGGAFRFADANTIALGSFPLAGGNEISLHRRDALPINSKTAEFSVIGVWEGEFADYGPGGKRVLTILENGDYELIVVAHGAGNFEAHDGLWKFKSSQGEFEDYGNYSFLDPNTEHPNRVQLNGRNGSSMIWEKIF